MAVAERKRRLPRADQRGGEPWLRLRLPARPEAVATARHALDGLDGLGGVRADTADALRLLVSEVVTNSIRHAGLSKKDGIVVTVRPVGHAVRVEVMDKGRGFDPGDVPAPSVRDTGGWGLYLVSKLADRWGVVQDGTTRVWFEIDTQTR